MQSRERKALWIEVRDSETGKRRACVYAAPVPRNRADREKFLNRYVPQVFPGAKLRTYSGGAGKFVVGALLITAHYGAVRDDAKLLPLEETALEPTAHALGQGALFAP